MWMGVSTETPVDAIPLAVLADLTDRDGELSVWLVADLEGSLRRVAAALQPKDKAPAKISFRVIERDRLTALGIDEPVKNRGASLDKELNDTSHYVMNITTLGSAIKLARALLEKEEVPFTQSIIVEELLHSVRETRISVKDFDRDLCKWLVREGKFGASPAVSAPETNGETPT